jgi:hypothetical protein
VTFFLAHNLSIVYFRQVKYIGVCILVLQISFAGYTQQNTLFLNNFYRDRAIIHDDNLLPSVWPVYESQLDLNKKIADSSRQYYELTEILFKKHLVEAKGKNYFIGISPLVDLSMGKDNIDTNERKLFQNTRVFIAEVDLGDKFSFSTSFFENQGRYANYQTEYYKSIGELYPGASNYNTQNAMIPGASRTKPFSEDGFDYAFARGNMIYQLAKTTWISAGNTPHFIGNGYRSIVLSDNSISTPFFRIDQGVGKFDFLMIRSRLINLMRRPVSTTVEATYETKAYSLNMVSYRPFKNLKLSVFESTVWSKGDSINVHAVHPAYYSPVPLSGSVLAPDSMRNSMVGFDLCFKPTNHVLLYGQYALTTWETKKYAIQMGARLYSLFNQKDLMFQIEWNQASNGMYEHTDARLNFSNGNTPMALIKGNGFNELIVRANYEWKRIYADYKLNFYRLYEHNSIALLPVEKQSVQVSGNVIFNQLEIGCRFNRKINLDLFASVTIRSVSYEEPNSMIIQVGLKTAILNSYIDF